MKHQILLVQGGSEGAYAADIALAESLRRHLGPDCLVRYPPMPDEDEPEYERWTRAIREEITDMGDGAFLVGHSIGASVVARAMIDASLGRSLAGVCLIAGPFWHDHAFWRWDEVALPADASARYPQEMPLCLYHGTADESVPVSHLDMYAHALPFATVRRLEGRDHQLGNDLREVAEDIRRLAAG